VAVISGTSLRSRRGLLLALILTAFLGSLAGLGAATLIKSPQQVAAEAGPPKASVISATVERRTLTETVVLRGTVAPGKAIDVIPAASATGKSVITRSVVKKGQRVKAGAVVAEVSGRPVIVLQGRIPAYRDIRPGMKGPDVRQLQAALRGLGYSVDDSPGLYGTSTETAVKRLYSNRGYEPPTEATQMNGGGAGGPAAGAQTSGKAATSKPKPKVLVKAGEVVFIPKFPARVMEVKAGLGAEVKGAVVRLAAGDLVVRGTLSVADHKLVKRGKPVRILSEDTGVAVVGRIFSIGAFTGGQTGAPAEGDIGAGGEAPGEPGYPIVITGTRPLPETLAGQDVRLTVEAASTEGPVLVVPSSAVYATTDGSLDVIKLFPEGRQKRITVRTGATGGGYVEVQSAELAEGDRVVVGK
jgi:multidrug efflux pump subunit AcrA (membrane-fusion protein)